MRVACVALLVLVPSLASAQPWSDVALPWSQAQHREFDFWMGEWDVNLRIRQDDGSWLDAKRAKAHIFRVLDGKAILELWDEQAYIDKHRLRPGHDAQHAESDALVANKRVLKLNSFAVDGWTQAPPAAS